MSAPLLSPRGRYAKTPARRREIIDAGIEVFAASGYRNGSFREIADRVGMSQAGLLHHFANKSELLAAVLQRRDDLSLEIIGGVENGGVDWLRGILRVVDDNMVNRGLMELHCVLSAEATSAEHPAHGYFVERYEYIVGTTERELATMLARGELRDSCSPATEARAIVGLWDGLQLQWLLNSSSVDMAATLRRYMQSISTVTI